MLQFRLLGPIEAYSGDQSIPLGGVKPRALLAALLLEQGRVVPTSRLVDIVWGDNPPETARALIQTYVSTLRQSFAKHGYPEVISTQSPGYIICVDIGIVDRKVFADLLQAGRQQASHGNYPAAAEQLRRACVLWRGPALTGLEHSLLAGEARRLDEMRMAATEERIAAELATGQFDHLAAELQALVGQHPTNERLRGQLMLTLFRLGRQADALACFHEGRNLLVEELGVEPGAELNALHTSILRGEVELLGPATPRAARQSAVPAQLPLAPADFTGRASLIAALAGELTATSVAIQVVTGQGGSGKSALAARVAHQVASSYPDGQLYAELRGMSDNPAVPGEVLGRFLRALGIDGHRLPESTEERGELYRTLLADRRVLVLLDDAANEQQVRTLLPGGPGCAVLVTSRDRLAGLAGAALTELEVLEPGEAADLLARLAGAERIHADRESADRITAACGNLPLAIRIAGARLATRRQLPLRVLADRLADERQRLDELSAGDLGVRTSIGLSWQALDPRMQTALRRAGYLGIPAFSAWVVSWLLDTTEAEAEQLLELLVDAQLVEFVGLDRIGCLQYRLHDLIRLYAYERAEQEEPIATLTQSVARVLDGWLTLIGRIAANSPPAEISWGRVSNRTFHIAEDVVKRVLTDAQGWFESEQSALVVGVERAAAIGLHELAYDFASARRSIEFEGANRFEFRARIITATLAASQRAADAQGEAVMLAEMAQLRYDQDLYPEARQYFGEALSRFRELRNIPGQAATLAGLGIACREPGFLTEALHFLDQAAILLRELHDDAGIGYVRRLSGSVRVEQGNYADALSDLEESRQAYEQIGSRSGIAYTLRTLGLFHRARGDYEKALRFCSDSAALFHELGDELMHSYAIRALAKAQLRLGRSSEALPQLESALAVARDAGDRWGQAATLRVIGQAHLAEGRLDLAESCLDAAMSIWDTMEVPLWSARTMKDLALLYQARGETHAADVALSNARKIFHHHGAREFAELNESYNDSYRTIEE